MLNHDDLLSLLLVRAGSLTDPVGSVTRLERFGLVRYADDLFLWLLTPLGERAAMAALNAVKREVIR